MPLGLRRQNQADSVATDEAAISKRCSHIRKLVENPFEPATSSPLISPDRAWLNHSIPMGVAGESDFVQ